MSRYIRPRMPGATVFFTVCLAQPGGSLLIDHIQVLRQSVRRTLMRRPFLIDAWVVLPDHMHAVWTLPENDSSYAERWGTIKARFSRDVRRLAERAASVGCNPTLQTAPGLELVETWDALPLRQDPTAGQMGALALTPAPPAPDALRLRAARSPSKLKKQDAGIWQRRFWEHHLRSQRDKQAAIEYCWVNPVKHGLVAAPEDWLYSSVHRDRQATRHVA